jgi:hypothetical protein
MAETNLEHIRITHLLQERSQRSVNRETQKDTLTKLARAMSESPSAVIQMLCDCALGLCDAGSAGISTLFHDQNGGGFDWIALSGRVAPFVGGKAPRDHSPCGVCLKLDAPQLFRYPERYFEWLQGPGMPVFEGLVIPLYGPEQRPYGTIWVMKHEECTGFDLEDVRIMKELGSLMSTALKMLEWFDSPQKPEHSDMALP